MLRRRHKVLTLFATTKIARGDAHLRRVWLAVVAFLFHAPHHDSCVSDDKLFKSVSVASVIEHAILRSNDLDQAPSISSVTVLPGNRYALAEILATDASGESIKTAAIAIDLLTGSRLAVEVNDASRIGGNQMLCFPIPWGFDKFMIRAFRNRKDTAHFNVNEESQIELWEWNVATGELVKYGILSDRFKLDKAIGKLVAGASTLGLSRPKVTPVSEATPGEVTFIEAESFRVTTPFQLRSSIEDYCWSQDRLVSFYRVLGGNERVMSAMKWSSREILWEMTRKQASIAIGGEVVDIRCPNGLVIGSEAIPICISYDIIEDGEVVRKATLRLLSTQDGTLQQVADPLGNGVSIALESVLTKASPDGCLLVYYDRIESLHTKRVHFDIVRNCGVVKDVHASNQMLYTALAVLRNTIITTDGHGRLFVEAGMQSPFRRRAIAPR